jgi:hypothetical protein
MTSTLSVLLSGVVGVEPRVLFLSTGASEAEVVQPGFMNNIENITGIQISQGDFILSLFENGTKREIFIADFGPGRVITLQGIAGDTNAPGGVTGGVNLGTGAGAYAGVSGNDLTFKSFKAGSNILLTPSGTEILISGLASGITGGNNLGTGTPVFAGVNGNNLEFKTLKAGANIALTPSGTEILVTGTGGGGSNFDYVDTWFVAINGSDLNDGKSVNTPKATLNGAQLAFTSIDNIINILDSGTYSDAAFFHDTGKVFIHAPGAIFNTTVNGNPLFWIQSGEMYINCLQIINNGASASAAVLQNGGVLSVHSHRFNSSAGPNMYYGTGGISYFDCDFFGGAMEFSNTVRVQARYGSGFWITNIGVDNGELWLSLADSDANISGTGTFRGQAGATFYGTVVP